MTLTIRSGPFGHRAGGQVNFGVPSRDGVLYFEDFPRWVRAVRDGEGVAGRLGAA